MQNNYHSLSIMKFLLYLSLACCFSLGSAAAQEKKKQERPPIRVNPNGFKSNKADILKVVQSASAELWKHFPDYQLENMVVTKGNSGPIVLYQRNALKEIVVRLDTKGTYWSQYSYQWAHEFCHILTGYRNDGRENKWFEETLCELASIYTMRAMAETWKTKPPYPNWKSYGKSLKKYADDVIEKRDEVTIKTLAAYYKKNETELRKDSGKRGINGAMAVALLPWFEEKPERWECIRYLNVTPAEAGLSFQDYMQKWHNDAAEKHQPFIQEIAKAYGLKKLSPKPKEKKK